MGSLSISGIHPTKLGRGRSFLSMGYSYSSIVEAPLAEVFAWHGRPGALARLSPPWLPGKVVAETSSLQDGQAVLGFPGGLRWVAQHLKEGYDPPHSFVDEVTSLPFDLVGWRHTHSFSEAGAGATRVSDEVRTPVPAALLRSIFAYRHRQLADDLASQARGRDWSTEPVTVAMTGPSGLIGSALAAFLTTGGHRVVRLVRRAPAGPGSATGTSATRPPISWTGWTQSCTWQGRRSRGASATATRRRCSTAGAALPGAWRKRPRRRPTGEEGHLFS